MKKTILALLLVASMLTWACGGGGAQPTATPTSEAQGATGPGATMQPTQPVAGSTAALTGTAEQTLPTTGPTQTTTTAQPTGIATQAEGGAAVPTGEPTVAAPTAGATDIAEPTAVATGTEDSGTDGTAGIPNVKEGRQSELAIPAAQLERLGLKFTKSDKPGPADLRLLKRFRGKQLLNNTWQGQDFEGILLVSDARWGFPTPNEAENYLRAARQEISKGAKKETKAKLVELEDAPEIGDETRAYLLQSKDPRAQTQTPGVYLVFFRNDRIVGAIVVFGDKSVKPRQVYDLARSAGKQVDQVLSR